MGEPLFKQCPNCNKFNSIESSICTNCNHIFVETSTETPQKKRVSCGQVALVSISVLSAAIFVGIALVFFLDDGIGIESLQEAPSVEEKQESNPINISAQTLVSEYRENEIAADQKYKGKLLYVTGVIEDFGVGLFERKYISISDGEMFSLHSIHCIIEDENVSQITDLIKGQEVEVQGLNSGMTILAISLDNCTVVEFR